MACASGRSFPFEFALCAARMSRKCFVEGNVAAGKTTLLAGLEKRGHRVVTERVDEFAEELAAVYEAPCGEHVMRLQTKIAHLCNESTSQADLGPVDTVVVFERSAFSTWGLFGAYYAARGLLSSEDISTLRHLDEGARGAWVYLSTPPLTCAARAARRARAAERDMCPQLIHDLHAVHEAVLNPRGAVPRAASPVLLPSGAWLVDGAQSAEGIVRDVEACLHSLADANATPCALDSFATTQKGKTDIAASATRLGSACGALDSHTFCSS